eukprot:scaffold81740_cov61-Phaeocystis_antarctica.AAC.2
MVLHSAADQVTTAGLSGRCRAWRTTASGIVVPMTIACCARRETRHPRQTSTRRQTRTSTPARRVRRCSNTWATTTTTGLQEGKRATSPKLASGAPRTRRHHHDPPPP